ncbi:histidine kinase [uncultured Bacteroides sp.]|uniref:sensor histidine kinase n=1 Tax=uncultured Bacteroides sp. TaxID=162156 RepID=UPI002AAC184B|nr:histidine kinase [uncultured Bacteroides sp.]
MKQHINNPRPLELLIHVIGWGILFGFPFFFMNREGNYTMNWMEYLRHSAVPFSFLVVFYANYLHLIPRYFFRQRIKRYVIINIILVTIVGLCLHFWQQSFFPQIHPPRIPEMMGEFGPKKFGLDHGHGHGKSNWIFFTRDLLSLILTVGLSAAIKISYRWTEMETARSEAEKSKTEAELKNLRNQLNPHFLLNTLNNIYALIAFSPDKAQQAVHDLSKLLRYVLYDNNQTFVPLNKEVDFIKNYIELMKIRLSDNVKVDVKINMLANSDTMVAPLLFITLIENSFKHGVSYSAPSFINIQLEERENGSVECCIKNSYFPKSEHDKSGSGIGLGSLKKRLELLYPSRYTWNKEIKDNVYTSILVINKE